MKKLIFYIITLMTLISCKQSTELKGKILFNVEWETQTSGKSNIGSFWVIPVQVGTDTLFVNYLYHRYDKEGVGDIVLTKLLYNLGYPIDNRAQFVGLGSTWITDESSLSIDHIYVE